LGSYVPSQVGAANIIMTSGVSNLDAPRYIARLRFPAYYRDVLLGVATKHNVDPLLFYALIRQESLFNPNATAAAGEKGLMQVIPDTAAYIAQQMNWPNYENTDLFRPYVAIEFGGFYLEEQVSRFDGNVYASLAAYNAGPGRAISWLQLAGSDPDLFMNTITIETTRHYIQLIYRNYNIYRALYGA
jgi:soluble lytic murein transglycosylase